MPEIVRAWDARADHYFALFRDELDGKPFDRDVLASFAERVGDGGRVCDVGCGPCAHVARLLAERGLDVLGIDVSPRCIELARREAPDCRFELMDQRAIDADAAGGPLDGIVSYYSLHDQPKTDLAATFASWATALRRGGALLAVAKEGDSEGIVSDPLGSGIPVYWAEFTAAELRAAAEASGFRVDDVTTRAAYENEIQTRRIYLSATRG